jgi:4-amino-4-deoxy-L-arabinose transferase-like glycosyltransferase
MGQMVTKRRGISVPISNILSSLHFPKKRLEIFYTLLIIVVAAIPPVLILQQRWFTHPPDYDINKYSYGFCTFQLLCRSTISSSTLILFFICSASLLLLFWLSRKYLNDSSFLHDTEIPGPDTSEKPDRRRLLISRLFFLASGLGFLFVVVSNSVRNTLPGWDLIFVLLLYSSGWFFREIHIPRENINALSHIISIALLISEMFLLVFMISSVVHRSNNIIPPMLLMIALLAISVYFFPKLRYITIILCLGIVLFSININAWQTSVIGDEYVQFETARSIAVGHHIDAFASNIFNAEGKYIITPMIASYIQAFFMKLFGADGFGWRISNVLLCAMGIGLLYFFYKVCLGEPLALAAAALLACSEYLISFSKIGYANLQAFFILSVILAAAIWAVRSNHFIAFVILGLSMGFAFYSFPAALYTLPIPILLLFIYRPPFRKASILRWGTMMISMGILMYPLFLQPNYWASKITGTFLDHTLYPNSINGYLDHFSSNAFNAYFSFLYVQQDTHYVSISYVDPLTGFLILLGISYALLFIRKSRFIVFSLLSFLIILLFAGVSHGYLVPPTTRMFLLLPWWVLFAVLGLKYVLGRIRSFLPVPSHLPVFFLAGILTIAAILNIHQSFDLSYRSFSDNQNIGSYFVKTAEEAEIDQPGIIKNYIVLMDNSSDAGDYILFKNVYPGYFHTSTIQEVVLESPDLSEDMLARLTSPNTIVFLYHISNPDWVEIIESELMERGRNSCYYTYRNKEILFFLYSPSEFINACR